MAPLPELRKLRLLLSKSGSGDRSFGGAPNYYGVAWGGCSAPGPNLLRLVEFL